jgi:hypothetical protein
MSLLPGETMRSAIHRCLATFLFFTFACRPQMLRSQESHVAAGIVISPATGHVTLLHAFAGLARIVLVVADFKGIRDG